MYEVAVEKLLKNGVGILPTDTLYGLVGRALSREAFEKVFKLKKRNSESPFIILVGSIGELDLFDIKIDENIEKMLKKYWPGKISIILPCSSQKMEYLHMGTKNLAFRMPDKNKLLELLKKTGPLVAPSVNHPGEKPATTIEEAKAYFGDKVDFYINEGKLESLPSTLIKIKDGKTEVLRKGAT